MTPFWVCYIDPRSVGRKYAVWCVFTSMKVSKSRLQKLVTHFKSSCNSQPLHSALFDFCPTNDQPGTNQAGCCFLLLWKVMKWVGTLQRLCGSAGQRNKTAIINFRWWVRVTSHPSSLLFRRVRKVAKRGHQLFHVRPSAASLDGYSWHFEGGYQNLSRKFTATLYEHLPAFMTTLVTNVILVAFESNR
jgi:hypothetical protein